LRSPNVGTNDLALAFKSLGEELASGQTNGDEIEFLVRVEGTPRDLHPITREEVYRVAGEALRNAFQHAQAGRIELAIRYGERQLGLHVRDNGRGFDPQSGELARAGHWGLAGMRERAELIDGQLEVWSDLQSGTEVVLTIPASNAYKNSPVRRRAPMFSKRQFARTNS